MLSRRQRVLGTLWVSLLAVAVSLLVVSDALPTGANGMRAGVVSPTDIVAPRRVVYTSALRTQREQDAAASRVDKIYTTPNRTHSEAQVNVALAVFDFIDAVRGDPYAPAARKQEMLAAIEKVDLSPEVISATLALPEARWRPVVTETVQLLGSVMRSEIRESNLAQVRRTIPSQIGGSLDPMQIDVVAELVGGLVVPTSFLDSERTEAAKQQARASVRPIEQTYEAGQIIVRRGEIITPEQVEALEALGLQAPTVDWRRIISHSFLVTLLTAALSLYILRLHPAVWGNNRSMGAVVVLLILTTALAKALVPAGELVSYLLPAPAVAMLLGVLIGSDLAMMIAVSSALIVGLISGSFDLAVYTFMGSALAALSLHRVERLHGFVTAGVLVGLANLGVLVAFALSGSSRPLMELLLLGLVGVVNGVLSASLTLVGFYVLSNLLGITTFLQLMELARPTTPLFKELLLKAPGTYHHSIVVSNLAERAAEATGADPLLVRVGAYYHDVGKTLNPHFFVENQAGGHNPHDDLDDPQASARLIIAHVTEGERLARRHGLPPRIIDFILQHHGTTLVGYFYQKACERHNEEGTHFPAPDRADFRYPGPNPQSREAAILLLADTIEAAARATRPAGAEEIDQLVRKLIGKKLSDGQLDECEITLRDLERIRRAFVEVLQGVYHPRIAYPADEPGQAEPTPSQPEAVEGISHEQRGTPDRRAVGTAG